MLQTKEFKDALNAAKKIVPSRTTMPILGGLLMQSQGNTLTLRADNLETSMTQYVEYDGPPINTVVPADRFQKIVSTIQDDTIELRFDEDSRELFIEFGNDEFSFRCMKPDEFPLPKEPDSKVSFEIDGEVLRNLISKTEFCASENRSHNVLSGILFESDGNKIKVAGADGFRMSHVTHQTTVPQFQMIVPADNLGDIVPALIGSVELTASENTLKIEAEGFEFTSQLIDGHYPDVDRIIPQNHTTAIEVNRRDILTALKRATVLAKESANIVKLNVTGMTMEIATSDQVGEGTSIIFLNDKQGEDLLIACNVTYLTEMLSKIASEIVRFEFTEATQPITIKIPDTPNFVHVLMPMHLGRR